MLTNDIDLVDSRPAFQKKVRRLLNVGKAQACPWNGEKRRTSSRYQTDNKVRNRGLAHEIKHHLDAFDSFCIWNSMACTVNRNAPAARYRREAVRDVHDPSGYLLAQNLL